MKRIVTLCLLVVLIVGLSGLMPASAKQDCQVAATGLAATGGSKSCSIFSPTGGTIRAFVIGLGGITVYGPNTFGSFQCPSLKGNVTCLGNGFVVEAGSTIILTVNQGVGRLESGALL